MTPDSASPNQDILGLSPEILALQPALLTCARRMARDEQEARHLVRLTLIEAAALPDLGGEAPDAWMRLLGLLRGALHSIARRRSARQERGHYANQRRLDDVKTEVSA